MKIRINNIECRKYSATKVDNPLYEIVKWDVNTRYGKEEEYRANGYEDSFSGDFLVKNGHSIQKTLFIHKEFCYTIATLELNYREPDVNLKSTGSRLLDLKVSEVKDFFKVYELANKKINKKHFKRK
jgi:hypothetical protein